VVRVGVLSTITLAVASPRAVTVDLDDTEYPKYVASIAVSSRRWCGSERRWATTDW